MTYFMTVLFVIGLSFAACIVVLFVVLTVLLLEAALALMGSLIMDIKRIDNDKL